METKVLQTLQKHRMVHPGQTVIVALSGGADSVALFHVMLALRQRLGIDLAAAHFDHGLRGAASKADAAFCACLCGEQGVTLYTRKGDMRRRPRPKGESEEAWARRLRYGFFEELAAEQGALIATAHTLSDQAETVLFHSIRGSGPRGLAGIPAVRGPFIRPLLAVGGEETRAYCEARGLAHVEDATNAQTCYTRNRLRLEVMPLLEAAHPGAQRALARTAQDMAALNAWLTGQAEALLSEAAVPSPGFAEGPCWAAAVLEKAPAPVRLQALSLLAGPSADRAALGRMEAVVLGGPAREQLKEGRVFCRVGGRLCWEEAGAAEAPQAVEQPLREGEVYALPGGYRILLRCVPAGAEYEQTEKSEKKDYTFWADCDRILQYGCLRTRLPQDRFAPPGRGLRKSLKQWMQEEGIPPGKRAGWPLIAERGTHRVLWVWGAGFAEGMIPAPGAERVLELSAWKE